jgi:formylglycine-generating enzyme required for sulfatase activity
MVCIEGGSFSGDGWWDSARNEYEIETLWMDRDEVTVEAFTACVNDGGCTDPNTGEPCNFGVVGRENHPVNCVDAFQAEAYCAWRGQRLPTEWEWQWAARGRDEGRTYPWGDAAPSCTYAITNLIEGNGCGLGRTWEVGSRSPIGDSRDGLRDMAGNVWEWTSSVFNEDEKRRIQRGASWRFGGAVYLETAARYWIDPSFRGGSGNGLRCVQTP